MIVRQIPYISSRVRSKVLISKGTYWLSIRMSLIQDLKITTLADNLTLTSCLGQWGLSFLLELVDARDNNKRVVFDTGMHKNSLFHNMKQMRVSLSDVDCVELVTPMVITQQPR